MRYGWFGHRPYLTGCCYFAPETRLAEGTLRERERMLQAILDATTESIILVDAQGIILAMNKSAARRLGLSADKITGLCSYDLFPPELAERRKAYNETVIRSGKPVTFNDKLGEYLFSNTIYPVFDLEGQVSRLAVFARDVTEQARAEAALKESEEKYRTLVENVPDIIYTLDKNGTFTSINDYGLTLLGYRKDELVGQHYLQVLHPGDAEKTKKLFNQSVPTMEERVSGFLCRILSKDEKVIWISINTSISRDKEGGFLQVQGVARDITEWKLAEERKRKICSIFERSIDGIAIGDLDFNLKYVNYAYAQMHGYATDEMIGMNVEILHNAERIKEFKQCVNHVKMQGSWKGEIEQIKKDGSPFPSYLSISLLKSADGKPTGFVAVSRDLSEHKQVVEALQLTEKKYKEIADFLPDLIYREIQILS